MKTLTMVDEKKCSLELIPENDEEAQLLTCIWKERRFITVGCEEWRQLATEAGLGQIGEYEFDEDNFDEEDEDYI